MPDLKMKLSCATNSLYSGQILPRLRQAHYFYFKSEAECFHDNLKQVKLAEV
jgi:hypothetical protein